MSHDHQFDSDSRQFWNTLYQERDQVWSGRVNPGLTQIAAPLKPGRALDVGCGEGGDSMWLARNGWRVTGLDISDTALGRARRRAAQEGIPGDRIQWIEHDLVAWKPTEQYDLVSAFFLQSQIEFPREQVLRTLSSAVAHNGILALVSHAAPPPWASESHRDHGRFPTPDQELAALELQTGNWDVLVSEVREREATGPDGQTGAMQDTVVVIKRVA